jgi:hypothetical protein
MKWTLVAKAKDEYKIVSATETGSLFRYLEDWFF